MVRFKFILICALITLLHSYVFAEKMVISVPFTSHEQVGEYIAAGFDIAQVYPHKQEVHIVVNHEQKLYFENKYGAVIVRETEAQMKANLHSRDRNIVGYNSYEQIVASMMELVEYYPDQCQLIELGPSQGKIYYDEGNENYADFDHIIYAMKLSNNPSVYQDKPNYLFFGNIHAREPLTAEICMSLMYDLVETYIPTDPHHPLNSSQIWIVPILNPDGRQIVFSERDVWHRKTVFDNNENGQMDYAPEDWYGSSMDGIDANRNFGYKWGTSGINFDFQAQTYPGTHPFSSIEAAYIRDLASEIPFVAAIDYHSHGNMVLYPYGYGTGAQSYNHSTIANLAEEMRDLMPSYAYGSSFVALPAWDLYPTSGDTSDYLHFHYNTLAFTIEVANEFIQSVAEGTFYKRHQLPALYHLLSRHQSRFLTGIVTDYYTSEPVKAEIKIFPTETYNPEKAPMYSDPVFGRYNYPLMPGQYQLLVRADNYHPHYQNITITNTEQTIVNVELHPATPFDKTFLLTHTGTDAIFQNIPVVIKHTRIDTLFTNDEGVITVAGISPGEMTLIAFAADQKTYIKEMFLSEIDIRNSNDVINVSFADFAYVDDFVSFSGNWTASSWAISNTHAFSGDTSARIINYATSGTLTSINPIQIPLGTKTYINFMGRYDEGIHATSFIEFAISDNRQDWETIAQIRDIEGWTNFYYAIPENMYERLYFRFRAVVMENDWDDYPILPFYLDLFCVSIDNMMSDTEHTQPQIPPFSANVYPNPFNPETTICLSLNADSDVSVNIYNIRGQLVKSLYDDFLRMGEHNFIWNGVDKNNASVSSGVYFYQIKTSGYSKHGKMILLK